MSRYVTTLCFAILSTALVSGTPASAAKLSKADKAIVSHVKIQCKGEATEKAKGYGFVERWKYYSDCVQEEMKKHPSIDPLDMD
jgi:hypothetical protein